MTNTLYIIRCGDGSLYTGITRRSWRKRFAEHKAGFGARHTRIHQAKKVEFAANLANSRDLVSAERAIKRWPRWKKEALIQSSINSLGRPKRRKSYRHKSRKSRY